MSVSGPSASGDVVVLEKSLKKSGLKHLASGLTTLDGLILI